MRHSCSRSCVDLGVIGNKAGKKAYLSFVKEIPKYSFSFKLKWDETKSSRSRDSNFG